MNREIIAIAAAAALVLAGCSASRDAGANEVVVPGVSHDAAPASPPPATAPATTPAAEPQERYLIAFAANLDSEAGCHYDDHTGCDVYTVEYNATTGAVSDLRRLTTSPAAEWFPSLSPDGCFVAFNVDTPARNTATVLHAASGASVSLGANTRFPDWSPVGDALAWASSRGTPQNIFMADAEADCATGRLGIGTRRQVTHELSGTGAGDPDFFPGGESLAFHIDGGTTIPAGAAVISADGSGQVELTHTDGSGHVAVRPDGGAVIAGQPKLPILRLIERTAEGWTAAVGAYRAGPAASYARFDSRYGTCSSVNPSYPAWLDDEHVIFGLQCGELGQVSFSHLFIAGIAGADAGSQVDLGSLIEELAGVEGKSLITASAIALEAPAAAARPSDVAGTVYLTLLSHNEEPNGKQPDYLANPAFYAANRAILVEIVNLLDEYGAAYNFQSDWNFLQAIAKYDTGAMTANTDGMNVLRWMSEVMGVEVDPHAHETMYNYADVAYLIEQLGVEPTNVAGGFLFYPYELEAWTALASELRGRQFPGATWQAEVLWGAATPLHTGEDEHVSGIWRPAGAETFFADDPGGSLVYIGTCGSTRRGLEALVADLESGAAPAGGFYTASVFLPAQGQWTDETAAQIRGLLESLEDEFATGRVQWANLTDAVELWETGYGSEASQYSCVTD